MVEVDKCKGMYGIFYVYKYDNHIASTFREGGWYEQGVISSAMRYVKDGDIVVDAGANMGTHTIPYAQRVGPKGKVYAFEIQTPIFEVLKMNVAKHNLKNVELFRKALGHVDDAEVEVDTIIENIKKIKYGNKLNYGAARLGTGGEKVKMMTLDSLNLKRLDFIKTDIEGAEPLFFYGARETIKRCRPVILLENKIHNIIEEVRKTVDIPNFIAKFDIADYCFFKLKYCKKGEFLVPDKNPYMKILVTGGAGFIGSHLVDLLIKEGHEVTVYDNLDSGKKENINPKAILEYKSICDLPSLIEASKNCDMIFHLAAKPRVLYSIKHPLETHKINVTGTLNVLLAAKANNIKKIVFASSSSVCGNTSNFPTKETEPSDPLCPYAAHKAIGEMYMKMFSKLWKMDVAVMRLFNIYGPRCDPHSEYALVISKFIHKIKKGETIEIYGDGGQSRDFTYVADAVKAMYLAKDLKGFNIINVGGGNPITINQIANRLTKEKMVKFVNANPGESRKTHADISEAKRLLKWTPKIEIGTGIKECIKYEDKL